MHFARSLDLLREWRARKLREAAEIAIDDTTTHPGLIGNTQVKHEDGQEDGPEEEEVTNIRIDSPSSPARDNNDHVVQRKDDDDMLRNNNNDGAHKQEAQSPHQSPLVNAAMGKKPGDLDVCGAWKRQKRAGSFGRMDLDHLNVDAAAMDGNAHTPDIDETVEKAIFDKVSDAEPFDVVAVDVGEGVRRETFKLEKSHASIHSNFLRAVLEQSIGELDQTITLPDVEAEVFAYFQDFLRMGVVISHKRGGDISIAPFGGYQCDKEWARLAKAWLLGERLESSAFRDAVVDALIAKVMDNKVAPINLYNTLYRQEVPYGSCMKRLLVDFAVWSWEDDVMGIQAVRKDVRFCPEFFCDLIAALSRTRWTGVPGLPPFARNMCIYHEHREKGLPCYRAAARI